LVDDNSETNALVYISKDVTLTLLSDIPKSARFGYVGVDSVFRDIWPPAAPISAGFFNQPGFEIRPILPNAIYLLVPNGPVIWSVAISKYFDRPVKNDLISINDDL